LEKHNGAGLRRKQPGDSDDEPELDHAVECAPSLSYSFLASLGDGALENCDVEGVNSAAFTYRKSHFKD